MYSLQKIWDNHMQAMENVRQKKGFPKKSLGKLLHRYFKRKVGFI